jgi:hypothetical protein
LWYDSGEVNLEMTDEKITIIEGPPPTFNEVQDGWALGLNETPYLFELSLTQLRTFNGPALVERCHRAWRNRAPIYLEYRDPLGLEQRAPILAARSVQTDAGQVLFLWVRRELEEVETEIDISDDEDSTDDNE